MSPISAGSMFELSTITNRRGHSLKLAKHRCNTDLRKYFFSERVVDRWNTLDERCIEAKTVNVFKAQLDRLRCIRMELAYVLCIDH